MRQEDEERNGGNDRQGERLEAKESRKDGEESKRQEEREGVS